MAKPDKEQIYRLLREIKKLASHASLTGSLSEGVSLLIKAYNECYRVLTEMEAIPDMESVAELDETASVDEVGIAASLLAAFIQPENMVEKHIKKVLLPEDCCEQ